MMRQSLCAVSLPNWMHSVSPLCPLTVCSVQSRDPSLVSPTSIQTVLFNKSAWRIKHAVLCSILCLICICILCNKCITKFPFPILICRFLSPLFATKDSNITQSWSSTPLPQPQQGSRSLCRLPMGKSNNRWGWRVISWNRSLTPMSLLNY